MMKRMAVLMLVATMAAGGAFAATFETKVPSRAGDHAFAGIDPVMTLDTALLLHSAGKDISGLALAEQLAELFRLSESVLARENLLLDSVFSIIVEVSAMTDRPVVNDVFKQFFPPDKYPARVILTYGSYKGGAAVRMTLFASRAPRKYLQTGKGQIPTGPFSQGVAFRERVYCSGVRPINPQTQKLVSDDFAEQTRQCIDNLRPILAAGGSDMAKSVSFVVYLTDMGRVPEVMDIFRGEGIDPAKKQLVFVPVAELNEYHPVEISCIGLIDG